MSHTVLQTASLGRSCAAQGKTRESLHKHADTLKRSQRPTNLTARDDIDFALRTSQMVAHGSLGTDSALFRMTVFTGVCSVGPLPLKRRNDGIIELGRDVCAVRHIYMYSRARGPGILPRPNVVESPAHAICMLATAGWQLDGSRHNPTITSS